MEEINCKLSKLAFGNICSDQVSSNDLYEAKRDYSFQTDTRLQYDFYEADL